MLTHFQSNPAIHKTRGAYAWSADGLEWVVETAGQQQQLLANDSAWEMALRLAPPNSTTVRLARRQRASLIRDPDAP